MNYDMEDLITIAKECVEEPAGMGDSILAQDPEVGIAYNRFLGTVVKRYAPAVCLELGVYRGIATAHMALGCMSTTVIGVDRDFHQNARTSLMRYPNVVLIEGDSTSLGVQGEIIDFLDRLMLEAGKERLIGLLFLDSTHDGKTPKREFQAFRTMFDEECLVVCDDILGSEKSKPKMQKFWEWLPGEKQELHFLHPPLHDDIYPEPGFGISIVRKNES